MPPRVRLNATPETSMLLYGGCELSRCVVGSFRQLASLSFFSLFSRSKSRVVIRRVAVPSDVARREATHVLSTLAAHLHSTQY